ncbi:MAG: hypothetical protein IKH96_01490 [Ruminococcus sp.]|uniref:hypothetical protein n=1 Tax=Ruminococcus sp. TaxID=41978 RepID=UPI0025FBD3E4|nr:hypothetical protein [Ruminococcus sp.]MBR6994671.1 hypothetical protein [Ruminococcus sp.]
MKEWNIMSKATDLSGISFTCGYYPLDDENLSRFYVDTKEARGIDVLNNLLLDFEILPQEYKIYQQVAFLGHIGSGKSTLLYQLEKALSSDYNVIRFSVQELLDINNISFSDLICVMFERTLFTFKDSFTKKDIKLQQRILDMWYATTQIEKADWHASEIDVDATAGVGISSKLVELMTKLTSSIKYGSEMKEKVTLEIKNDINKYIAALNDLLQCVCNMNNKSVLFLFEDLEKISVDCAEEIFVNRSDYFRRINAGMLLTTPIYLKYNLNFINALKQNFTCYEICPMIAVTDKNHVPLRAAVDTMKKIVYKRVDESLIDEEVLKKMILASGGVLRDLFSMLTNASKKAKSEQRTKIEEIDYEYAFDKLQIEYSDVLREEYLDIILSVYNNPDGLVQNKDDYFKLMKQEVIIEYNCEQWRGVHPAVIKYLEKKHLLEMR